MGITLSGLERLLAPLQALIGWVPAAAAVRSSVVRARAPAVHPTSLRGYPRRNAPAVKTGSDKPRRPLRVVRVVEACPPASGAGRMIISGRLADVCAELDRLAALEKPMS